MTPVQVKDRRLGRMTGLADTLGIATSALCLVHCLAMPLLLALLPAVGWASDDRTHALLVGVALLAALLSMGPGYAAHRRKEVLLAGGTGLACLAIAAFVIGPRYGHGWETAASVAGAALLGWAHLRNRICCRRHSAG
ncbi:MerC domain-containing protein [Pseudoduganella plicata]|nr:MerC domain-containing protein [Pseudoduganella plicata]GGY99895.1 hypothetical protein GCM10007388_37000 [Pseudoduganella plicata]